MGLTRGRPLAALVLTAPVRALKVAFPRDLRQGRALHHRRPCRQPAVSRTLCAEGGHRCGQGGSAVPERDGDRDAQVQSEAQRGRARDGTPTAASYGHFIGHFIRALHEDRRDRQLAVSEQKRAAARTPRTCAMATGSTRPSRPIGRSPTKPNFTGLLCFTCHEPLAGLRVQRPQDANGEVGLRRVR